MELFGLTLDPFQEQAIASLSEGRSVLVCAPTGTGKTLVADWVVKTALESGGEVIYTAPIKALSNQKFRDYCRLFGEDRTGLVTGDLVIRRDAPCRVMTTEILRNMLLSGDQLPNLRAVVIDEIHFLDDRERGTTWEEVLIYLPPEVQIVGLSATISNLEDFSQWLSHVRGGPVDVIVEEQRAVPLQYLVATKKGGLMEPDAMERYHKRWMRQHGHTIQRSRSRGRRGRNKRDDRIYIKRPTRDMDVFNLLKAEHLPYLYFVFSRRDAENNAKHLSRNLHKPLLDKKERALVDERLEAFREEYGDSALTDPLVEQYRRGVAFHHAGLHVLLKALVEELYEARLIKVLYCTSTFALGINMPARAAVFDSLKRYDGRQMIWLPTREFMQMAGRAGRRGLDDAGLVVIRADPEEYADVGPIIKKHLKGRYEPVRSSFSLSFNSVVNLLRQHSAEQIREIIEKSFLSYYRNRRSDKLQDQRDQIRAELEKKGWEPDGHTPKGMGSKMKQLRKVEQRIMAGTTKTWEEFEEKVGFLVNWGYLDEDLSFMAGATALQHMQIQEIFVTEVFLAGLFEHLEAPVLFGVLCGMCMELPRGAFSKAGKRHRGLGKAITKVRHSDIVVEAERMTHMEVVWDPGLIPLGEMWAEGKSLDEVLDQIQAHTDIAGDLVGAFRRAKDLGKQLTAVWADDAAKIAMVRELLRGVSRDEVEVVA